MIFDEYIDFSEKNIKKVLFVSDSHMNNSNIKKVIEKIDKYIDLIVHLGDMECEPEIIAGYTKNEIIFLKGNMDTDYRLPKNAILKIKGHKLFLTHGVGYMGEYSLGEMRNTALNNGCDVIAMGHTHKPLINYDEETHVTCINPGSISKPRQYPAIPSYMVMNVREDKSLEFVDVYLR